MSGVGAKGRLPPNTVMVEAPAKLNLFLRVLGRWQDGFHEVETVLLPLSLADRLRIHAHSGAGQFRTLSLSLAVTGEPPVVARVPADETNLVLRAAAALAQECDVLGFAEIELEKHVPAGAGLGGGSSDAAATLRALNDLWGCALAQAGLEAVGARVGSDVPGLMRAGAAFARGRGERVGSLSVPSMRWALVTFPFEVRTADAYAWWDQDVGVAGGAPGPSGDPRLLLEEAQGGDVRSVGALLFNDLESPVVRRHPEVGEARDRLLASGAAGAVMCGSGPTVAGLFEEDTPMPEGAIEVRSL